MFTLEVVGALLTAHLVFTIILCLLFAHKNYIQPKLNSNKNKQAEQLVQTLKALGYNIPNTPPIAR